LQTPLRHRLLVRLAAALLSGIALLAAVQTQAREQKITIAAASDLKFAMDEIVADFRRANATAVVDVVYGSSGKFHTQIRQGAPYDLYFSADIEFPRSLARDGLAASPVHPYALGRIVLWSSTMDATGMHLEDLADPAIARIAIANPRHAPYGKRAEEALRATGLWQQIEPKLVYGESVSHAAQFVQSGNAQIGIIALSLALGPELAGKGGYRLIDESLHQALEQGFIVTQRARDNALAWRFAGQMDSAATRATLARYGFVMPASQ
jgi:molybdate transport system substrate-binding protein